MDPLYRAVEPLRSAFGVGASLVLLFLRAFPWSGGLLERILICFSGQDPKIVQKSLIGQRVSSCRIGLQAILGGIVVGTACFVALTKALGQNASPAVLAGVSVLAGSIIVLIDVAAIEKAHQLHGEREATTFRLRAPRRKLGWAVVGGITLSRFALATMNANFIATLLLTVLLQQDIQTILSDDADKQNAPLVESITLQVDAVIRHDCTGRR
jgi:hypothetical protein